MRIYETIYICPPNLDEESLEDFSDLVRELIYENGGKIIKQATWGKKRLAYEINHFTEGVYYYFLYGGEQVNINELERRLRLAEECIRFLTVRLDKELKGKKHKIFTREELRLALQMDSPPERKKSEETVDEKPEESDKKADKAKEPAAEAQLAEEKPDSVKKKEPAEPEAEEKKEAAAEPAAEEQKKEAKAKASDKDKAEAAEEPAEAADTKDEKTEEEKE